MFDSAARIGLLHADALSPEQQAAHEWCRAVAPVVETVSLPDVADGTADLDRYDVLWWHRDGALEDGEVGRAAPAIHAYVDRGGALLLSLRALSAVVELDIDPVGPDATGVEGTDVPTGYLLKTLYAGSPVFDAFEELRVPTCEPGETPYARYEAILPENGEALGGTVRDGEYHPHELPLVSWRVGEGSVLGAGSSLTFAGPAEGECARNRSELVRALLAALAAGESPGIERPREREGLREMRERLADDPLRPSYHLTPPANWLNDPNGLIEWNDRYHVFYQYNPGGPMHGTIHWGHAVSDDLVHWEDERVALSPSPDGPDRDGCWSGCAVDDDGTPTLLYTGGRGRKQLPCRATTADPDLRTWEKDPDNPIIPEPPADLDVIASEHWEAEFRDHCVWHENGRWQQLIGAGIDGEGGAVLRYTGETLRDWEYAGPLLIGDGESDGAMWECPELLDLGDTQLLHVSNYDDVRYFLGRVEDGRFRVEHESLLDHGDFYAPQSLFGDERYLLWGWIFETRDEREQWDAGWSGALSIPRDLSSEDGELRQRPAPELEALRRSHARHVGLAVENDERSLDVRGRSLELEATVRSDADEAGITVFESPDGVERTRIELTDGELVVRREDSSPASSSVGPRRMPIDDLDRPLSIRAFLDGSTIELFVNERRCLTTRVYPTRSDSDGLSVYAHGGSATFEELHVWELGPAWGVGGENG
jgi:beta-fructofuranosidase